MPKVREIERGGERESVGGLALGEQVSGAALRQLVAPHGSGNLAGRVGTPASPVLPLERAGRSLYPSMENSSITAPHLMRAGTNIESDSAPEEQWRPRAWHHAPPPPPASPTPRSRRPRRPPRR